MVCSKTYHTSRVWYFATFISPSKEMMTVINNLIYRFVVGKTSASTQSTPHLHPNRHIASLPCHVGGVRLVDVPTQVQALQGKLVARLLEPERHPWKSIFPVVG